MMEIRARIVVNGIDDLVAMLERNKMMPAMAIFALKGVAYLPGGGIRWLIKNLGNVFRGMIGQKIEAVKLQYNITATLDKISFEENGEESVDCVIQLSEVDYYSIVRCMLVNFKSPEPIQEWLYQWNPEVQSGLQNFFTALPEAAMQQLLASMVETWQEPMIGSLNGMLVEQQIQDTFVQEIVIM